MKQIWRFGANGSRGRARRGNNWSVICALVVGVCVFLLSAIGTAGATESRAPRGSGLDSRFGRNGAVRLPDLSSKLRTRVENCFSLSDGSVLALATAESPRSYGSSTPRRDFIAKFTRRGVLATNFATGGLYLGPRRSSTLIQSVDVDSLERPLLLMRQTRGDTRGRLELIRLTEDGHVDHAFGPGRNGVAPVKGRFSRWGFAKIFPLTKARVLIAVATPDSQTRLVILNRSGLPDHRFSDDGRMTLALSDISATEMKGGDLAVAGTVKSDAGQKVQAMRLRPDGAPRLDWSQGGTHEIASIPASALPPDLSETDANKLISRNSVQSIKLMTAQQDGGLLLGIVSSDEDAREVDVEWLRRLNGAGFADVTFGSNGNAFGQFETMFDGEETQVNQFELLPASHSGTLALTLNNPTDHTALSGTIIGRDGHERVLPVWKIRFHEDFSEAVFGKPHGRTMIGCGTAQSIADPLRLDSYVFAVKLPRA